MRLTVNFGGLAMTTTKSRRELTVAGHSVAELRRKVSIAIIPHSCSIGASERPMNCFDASNHIHRSRVRTKLFVAVAIARFVDVRR